MDDNNISNEALTELQIKIKDYSDNVFKQITEEVSSDMTNKTKDVIDLLGKDIIESIYGDLLNAINESTSQSEINETLRKTYDDKIKLIYDLAKDINESDKKNEEIIKEELSNGKVENSEKVVVKEEKTEEKEPEEEKIVEEESEEKTEEKEPEEEKIVEEKPQAEEIIEEQKENEQLDKTLEDVKNVEEKIEKKNSDEVDLTSWLKNLPLLKGKESNNEEESTTIIDTAKVKLMSLFGGSREKEETEEKNKNEDKTKNPPNIKDESWFKEKNLLTYQEYLLINSLKTPGDTENNKSIAIANLVRARIAWMSAQVEYFDKMMKNNKKINKAYMKETSILSKIMGAGEEGFSLFTTFLKGKLLLIAAAAVTAILLCFEKTRGWVIEGLSKLKEWAWNAAENLFTTWVDSALLGYDNPNGPTGVALLDSLLNTERVSAADADFYVPIGPNGKYGYELSSSFGKLGAQSVVQYSAGMLGKPVGDFMGRLINLYNAYGWKRAEEKNKELFGFKRPGSGEITVFKNVSDVTDWKKSIRNSKEYSPKEKEDYLRRLNEIEKNLLQKKIYVQQKERGLDVTKTIEGDKDYIKAEAEFKKSYENINEINEKIKKLNLEEYNINNFDKLVKRDRVTRPGVTNERIKRDVKQQIEIRQKVFEELKKQRDGLYSIYNEKLNARNLSRNKAQKKVEEENAFNEQFTEFATEYAPNIMEIYYGNQVHIDSDKINKLKNEIDNINNLEEGIKPEFIEKINFIYKNLDRSDEIIRKEMDEAALAKMATIQYGSKDAAAITAINKINRKVQAEKIRELQQDSKIKNEKTTDGGTVFVGPNENDTRELESSFLNTMSLIMNTQFGAK